MLWEQGEANDADKPLPNPSLYLDERKTSWLMQRSRKGDGLNIICI